MKIAAGLAAHGQANISPHARVHIFDNSQWRLPAQLSVFNKGFSCA
jgi:hypothetical protein